MRFRSFVLTLVSAAIFQSQGFSQPAPNIIMIIPDDMGWSDTSQGLTNLGNPNGFFETPTLEALAAEGMAFTSAYATPTCASTRAMLYSGQYPTRPTNNIYSVLNLNDVGSLDAPPTAGTALTGAAITYAERLKLAPTPYGTAHIGKWHVGSPGTATGATNQGFDVDIGGTNSGGPGDYHASGGTFGFSISATMDPYAAPYTEQYIDDNIKPFATGVSETAMDALDGTQKHVTDAMVDAFVDYVANTANQAAPWYVNYAVYAPHFPVENGQARSDLLAKYQAKQNDDNEDVAYAALLDGMDQSLARIKHYLENTDDPRNPGFKLADNTLLVFYGDNGGETPDADNGPLSGDKVTLLEGGIRVPMLAWSKNTSLVDAGSVVHDVVGPADFYRTLVELAGATEPDPGSYPLDGQSLVPLLADSNSNLDRSLVFHFPGFNNFNGSIALPQTMIRRDNWKLAYFYQTQTWELYDLDDLDDGINEQESVVEDNPAVFGKLALEMIQWLVDQDAPLMELGGSQQLQIDGLAYSEGQITLEDVRTYTNEEFPLFIPRSLLPAGDFDLDGDIDEHDIDLLAMKEGSTDPVDLFLYDLDGNGMIEFFVSDTGIIASDSDVLIRQILGTQYGDANLDLEVELIDLDLLSQGWNGEGTGWFFGDFNGRDGIELGDLDILSQWFNSSTAMMSAAASSPVPEPSSIMMMLLLGAILSLDSTRYRSKTFPRS